ncbi:transposase-like protein [Paraphaeosphaeria sporulosa]
MPLTAIKQRKRQKQSSQLEEYYDSLLEDLEMADHDKRLSQLLNDRHRWWVEISQIRYPTLYKMAMDHLLVPATLCDYKRCFSSAKHTVMCNRNSLSPAVIEAYQL